MRIMLRMAFHGSPYSLAMPANLLSFCLASTYDVLPSPSNLKRWRICTESSCFLCSKEICTTAHVLGACKVSLSQGRFTIRHDSVLSELASILSSFIKAIPSTPPKRLIKLAFVKAGKSVSKSKVKPTGILNLASDWVIVSDLQNSYIFPGHIALTSLRPDTLREVMFANSRNLANFQANSRKFLLAKCPKVSHSRKLILAKKNKFAIIRF